MKRRAFLKTTGIAAAAFAALPDMGLSWAGVPSRQGQIVQGRKINIACVGVGGQGKSELSGSSSENIVALCDVDYARAAAGFGANPQAKKYKDFRKMLLEMDDEIDAVTVTTPDHMHFPIAMMAIKMGKHVFVQKPLTHTIEEARTLTKAAREHNVVTQMGNQGHAGEGTRLLKEWVMAGAIGTIREAHIWTHKPVWPQGLTRPSPKPVPESLDWNLWLGVAPWRPYAGGYAPFDWRGWWDFGCGCLGDMGCHILDAPFWALDLKYPTSISAESEGATKESGPLGSIITYEFPARGDMPPVTVKWYDGTMRKSQFPFPKHLEEGRTVSGEGGVLVGDNGSSIMYSDAYCKSLRIIPETAMQAFSRPEKTIPRVPDNHEEWKRAIKGHEMKPGSNFDHSGPLTEMILAGNLAIRIGKTIEWDGPNMRCTNIPEANELVRKPYRVF